MFSVKFSKTHSVKINGEDNELKSDKLPTRKMAIAASKFLKKHNIPKEDYKFILNKTGREITL